MYIKYFRDSRNNMNNIFAHEMSMWVQKCQFGSTNGGTSSFFEKERYFQISVVTLDPLVSIKKLLVVRCVLKS